jgi:hypothetical protein
MALGTCSVGAVRRKVQPQARRYNHHPKSEMKMGGPEGNSFLEFILGWLGRVLRRL